MWSNAINDVEEPGKRDAAGRGLYPVALKVSLGLFSRDCRLVFVVCGGQDAELLSWTAFFSGMLKMLPRSVLLLALWCHPGNTFPLRLAKWVESPLGIAYVRDAVSIGKAGVGARRIVKIPEQAHTLVTCGPWNRKLSRVMRKDDVDLERADLVLWLKDPSEWSFWVELQWENRLFYLRRDLRAKSWPESVYRSVDELVLSFRDHKNSEAPKYPARISFRSQKRVSITIIILHLKQSLPSGYYSASLARRSKYSLIYN